MICCSLPRIARSSKYNSYYPQALENVTSSMKVTEGNMVVSHLISDFLASLYKHCSSIDSHHCTNFFLLITDRLSRDILSMIRRYVRHNLLFQC